MLGADQPAYCTSDESRGRVLSALMRTEVRLVVRFRGAVDQDAKRDRAAEAGEAAEFEEVATHGDALPQWKSETKCSLFQGCQVTSLSTSRS